jgi:hypothetical protein
MVMVGYDDQPPDVVTAVGSVVLAAIQDKKTYREGDQ